MDTIRTNIEKVNAQISAAAVRCGRDPHDITLVAVTKNVEPERINQGIQAGLEIIGENRLQEAAGKREDVLPVHWHFIGHLQTNKVKNVVGWFEMVHSVDSLHLAREISKWCVNLKTEMPVLIEVNTSGEESKYGLPPEETVQTVGKIAQLPNIHVRGLMTIGALSEDAAEVRNCFSKLRGLSELVEGQQFANVRMKELSMGMSSDFEIAIEEGATMVRIGSALFGERKY